LAETENVDLLAQKFVRVLTQFKRLGPPKGSIQGFKLNEVILLDTLVDSIPRGAHGIKASELSNQLQVTPAAVTHLVNDLEKAGHVERDSDLTDRRIVLIRPTMSGLRLIEIANAQLLETLKGLIEFLGEDDSRDFIRLMSSTMAYFKSNLDT
jgi:DNA-binding MarR family transcriptional regulator